MQQAGVTEQPRTCLHALLGLLEKNINKEAQHNISPKVIELGYKLLYQLCSHPNMSDIVLRFLRSFNFLGRQVSALPFSNDHVEWIQLSQMSWLLKSVAVEIKVTADKGLQSHMARLASLFLYEAEDATDATTFADATDRSLLSGTTFLGTQDQVVMRSRPKIALLLDAVDLTVIQMLVFFHNVFLIYVFFHQAIELISPSLEFFDPGAIEAVVKQCEIVSDEGVQLTKLSLLQNRLRSELANLTNVALSQRQSIMQEVQNLLSFVAQHNNVRFELAARRFFLEGWRQVLECLLATGSLNEVSQTNRWNILTQITQDTFTKCLAVDNILPELVLGLSGVMIILLVGLRACALEGSTETGGLPTTAQVPNDYVKCLDGTILRSTTSKVQL